LELELKGRHINTYVDGELINATEDKLPAIEPLYYSASTENSTGDIILKVVNVQEQMVTAQVKLEDLEQENLTGSIFEMSGYKPEAENSFEAPELVAPKEREFKAEGTTFQYEFPKQSITIFRFIKSEENN
jgi:alpha-L-arabinofuranosidase